MFKGLGNLAGMMQQAQEMGAKMKELQTKLEAERVTGEGGGGMVTVEMTGSQRVIAVRIDPSLLEKGDREMIEELTATAVNDASERAKQAHAAAMTEITGGMNLPGMGDMLNKLTGGQQ